MIPTHTIIGTVARHFGVPASEILSRRRGSPDVAFARSVAMWLRVQTGHSLQAAARSLGRSHHTTALNAVQAIQSRLEADTAFRDEMQAILARLTDLSDIPQMDPYVARELHRYGQTTRPEVARTCIEQAVNALRVRRGAPTITWPA